MNIFKWTAKIKSEVKVARSSKINGVQSVELDCLRSAQTEICEMQNASKWDPWSVFGKGMFGRQGTSEFGVRNSMVRGRHKWNPWNVKYEQEWDPRRVFREGVFGD